jgi:hypothetical protein
LTFSNTSTNKNEISAISWNLARNGVLSQRCNGGVAQAGIAPAENQVRMIFVRDNAQENHHTSSEAKYSSRLGSIESRVSKSKWNLQKQQKAMMT